MAEKGAAVTREINFYSLALAFIAGVGSGAIVMDVAHERQKAAEAAKPKLVRMDIRPAAQLIGCSTHDRLEYARVCLARKRSTEVR